MPKPIDVPVEFSKNVNMGETATIGVTALRDDLPLPTADLQLNGRRVDVQIATGNGEAPNQDTLPDLEDAWDRIRGVVDIPALHSTPEMIRFRLQFNRQDVDDAVFLCFAGKRGRLKVLSSEKIPEKNGKHEPLAGQKTFDSHEDTGPSPRRGRPKKNGLTNPAGSVDEGAKHALSILHKYGFSSKAKLENLAQVVGATIGELERTMRENELWHMSIPGFGDAWVNKLIDAHVKFRADYPQPEAATASGPTAFDKAEQTESA